MFKYNKHLYDKKLIQVGRGKSGTTNSSAQVNSASRNRAFMTKFGVRLSTDDISK